MSTTEALGSKTTEVLIPIDIEDTLTVIATSGLDVLRSAQGPKSRYVRWSPINTHIGRRVSSRNSEQSEVIARRDAIDKLVSLTPAFLGQTHYILAVDDVEATEGWMNNLGYSDLAIAANALSTRLKESRLADCCEQAARIDVFIKEDTGLHVMLTSKPAIESYGPSYYKIASLKGVSVDVRHDELVPGLVIATESGMIGGVPQEYHPFGLFVQAS